MGEKMITQVVKHIRWSMGHRLVKEYPGKCKNLHGHEYLAEIKIATQKLDRFDFVVDFKNIKDKIKKWIDDNWDHGCMVSAKDTDLMDWLDSNNQKMFVIDDNSTAENIARYLFEIVDETLADERLWCSSIKVWETPDSYAEVQRNANKMLPE